MQYYVCLYLFNNCRDIAHSYYWNAFSSWCLRCSVDVYFVAHFFFFTSIHLKVKMVQKYAIILHASFTTLLAFPHSPNTPERTYQNSYFQPVWLILFSISVCSVQGFMWCTSVFFFWFCVYNPSDNKIIVLLLVM